MRICELPFERRTWTQALREQASHIGDAPFLFFEDEEYTYGDADRLVDEYAAGLGRIGVDRGTIVAIMMANGPENLWVTLAVTRLGAVFVPINGAYRGTFLRHVL